MDAADSAIKVATYWARQRRIKERIKVAGCMCLRVVLSGDLRICEVLCCSERLQTTMIMNDDTKKLTTELCAAMICPRPNRGDTSNTRSGRALLKHLAP